jgi:NADH dehydrogenase FAD-containing subunit
MDAQFPRVFACGDVAATGGPKMGRAALFQSEVLAHNITSLIRGRKILETYKPIKWIEGSLKLTLGRVSLVLDRLVEQHANPCCAVSDRNILARQR